jgi:hypothetical protein
MVHINDQHHKRGNIGECHKPNDVKQLDKRKEELGDDVNDEVDV